MLNDWGSLKKGILELDIDSDFLENSKVLSMQINNLTKQLEALKTTLTSPTNVKV